MVPLFLSVDKMVLLQENNLYIIKTLPPQDKAEP